MGAEASAASFAARPFFGRRLALQRPTRPGAAFAPLIALVLLVSMACQAEQRPSSGGGGSVQRIGSPVTGSVSGATGSVSGVAPVRSGSPGASPVAASGGNTPGDGVYTPAGNVDGYLQFGTDLQDITALTNAVNEGRPMPTQEIIGIYQNGKNFIGGNGQPRPLRAFARAENRAREFPEAAQFFGGNDFLDEPLMDAITLSGNAVSYSPAQQRQAIQKSVARILYYHTLQELRAAIPRIEAGNIDPASGAPHNVDEAWAIYMGAPDGTTYPRSLSATARSREQNFNREGAVDRPLREALQQAQRAAAAGNMAQFSAAQRDVESRLNAIFYLSAARYLNEALRAAQSGNMANAAATQAEGLYYYMTIQPLVARADPAADQSVVRYYRADPAALTAASRDETLNALNRTLTALGLTDQDRVTPANFQ